jgi:WhiB family transcriptional regulator, redox-sensing transcriptional regulator
MAPMQWRDATVGGKDTTGFEAFSSQIRQEPDVRQVQAGNIGQIGKVSVATQSQFMVAGPVDGPVFESPVVESPVAQSTATALPIGLDLPCTEDPELFFAESPQDVEQAKAMCRDCRARMACLTGALERREPWGVWGGELLMRGAIVPRKRPRGRPRKTEVAA